MSAIQCWPQLFGHPAICSFSCSSNPGMRSSSSSTSQRAKLFVSVNASLQNSEPVQAMVPRANGDAATGRPAASRARATVLSVFARHVHQHQVLHIRGADFAAGISFGKFRGSAQLIRADPAAQHGRSDVRKSRLFLRVYSHVVAISVLRNMLQVPRDRA